ncbi:MAG: hypothetical protein ONB16_01625 [candidate division KSB1 bacterium]|nr:hypothetical protein [candidate division KSB1 bacterium]MDZ7319452.1 hypothetical protein [candidate division KSB1 bacterium]MDZ7340557.1 hypothetical protein [candidate division KSB1 bacterium]
MVTDSEEAQVLEKKIDKLKKRILSLNKAIALQANKIADTNTLMVISRDENILLDRIQKKKKAIEELAELRRGITTTPMMGKVRQEF